MPKHTYRALVTWKGNKGEGTKSYRGYDRHHTVSIPGKPDLQCSSDPAFHGDQSKYNPEELLVSSLSGCHMLWYLHLCAENGINVTTYEDHASGTMTENGSVGFFSEVVLKPVVTITDIRHLRLAMELHSEANKRCFIANSCNFPVRHEAVCNAGSVI
ncbi:MAG: OsmC family protein [Ferruginibacter sp.]